MLFRFVGHSGILRYHRVGIIDELFSGADPVPLCGYVLLVSLPVPLRGLCEVAGHFPFRFWNKRNYFRSFFGTLV